MCALLARVFEGFFFLPRAPAFSGIIRPRRFDVKREFNATSPQKMLVIAMAVFLVVRLGKLGNEEAFKASLCS